MSEQEKDPGHPQHDERAREFFTRGDRGHVSDDAEMAESIKKRPKSRRNSVVMALVVAMSLYLMWDMRSEFVYFFRSPEPRILGSIEELRAQNLKDNAYVVLNGIPDPRKAQIELTNMGIQTSYYLYYAYLGNSSILGREKVREIDRMQAKEEYDTSPRVGRLFSFAAFPKKSELRQVRAYFKDRFDREFTDRGWVLLVGEKPWSDFQYPLLYLLLAAFAGYNGWQLYRRYFEP